MKIFFALFSAIIIGTACVCEAQSIASQQAQVTIPAPTPDAITVQDGNSRVWQWTDYQTSPTGEVITNIHSYTELCSGLNHLVNAQWVESSEQIDILPNGTAVATNGQHQAYFPGDIYQGQIELATPDGLQINSRPLGLNYFDGTNTVLIAELTNSIGVVSGDNQVIYPNAFSAVNGFQVDLRYTYTKAGFEQDVVIKQQPPTPESLGLNPDTARLQVMTEFFSAPQPAISSSLLPAQAGLSLPDQTLDFGTMEMVLGRAFLMGQNAQECGALVSKSWVQVNGRQVLIEEVPVDAILEGLAALPLTAMNPHSNKNSHTASKHLKLPPQRLAQNSSEVMLMAKADAPSKGFVLDYQTLNSNQTNYTFRGDTTYYVSGSFYSFGTNTFEGGAVIKYATNGTINITPAPPGSTTGIQWQGAAYRPVIFTAVDDNSVGEIPSFSTGNPSGHYYGNPMLYLLGLSPVPTVTGIRMNYANTAMQFGGATINIYGGQFVNCQYGFGGSGGTVNLYNALFSNSQTNCFFSSGMKILAQNVTFSGSGCLLASPGSSSGDSLTLSNCILVNITNVSYGYATPGGSYNGFYSASTFGTPSFSSAQYPFQSVGAGNCYLTNGSAFRNVGTTNIDPSLLASLKQKTTYPPILLSYVTNSINTTLSPQAQRDSDTPDLGYHYDPLDFLTDVCVFTNNVLLTISSGTAIGGYNTAGILLQDGSSIVSIGTPTNPNWFVRYQSVQEQPVSLDGTPSAGWPIDPYHFANAAPSGTFCFTKFACPTAGGSHLYHYISPYSFSNLLVQNCEFWSGANLFGGSTNTVATLENNLFSRSTFSATPFNSTAISYLYVTNNLFWGVSSVVFGQAARAAASTNWSVFNNDFDSCSSIGVTTVYVTNGYNAYLNCTGYVYPTNATDIFSSVGLVYQTGPLGTYYQPSSSPLINMGSTTADLVGLYHYTVITNLVSGQEIKETNSIVDIGYHYVAVDTNGIPIDTNGDGIPDYLEDANGNGLVDSGEIGWNITGDLGLQVIITRPRNGNTLP